MRSIRIAVRADTNAALKTMFRNDFLIRVEELTDPVVDHDLWSVVWGGMVSQV